MAVDASQLNLFPRHILSNREMMSNGIEGNGNLFDAQIGYGVVNPFSGTITATEVVLPVYGSMIVPAKTAAISRKRLRESSNYVLGQSSDVNNRFTFLGEDISFEIQQHRLETDRFIAQHTEKVRMEIEERRRRYYWSIAAAVEERVKAKDEEIQKIGKLNWELEERVKYLCVENQLWRELAERNEATANALRCNLEQLVADVDDAESCCGESEGENVKKRMCRKCGKEESCVLVLPCRHLCVCTICVPTLQTCPICNSTKTATLHVNLSHSQSTSN